MPAVINGTKVIVRDSSGVERSAPLFFVSPGQINFQVPAGTATGTAQVSVTSDTGLTGVGYPMIKLVAPGVFAADASGAGYPAAFVLRYRGNDLIASDPVVDFDPSQNKFVPKPIDPGSGNDTLFLALFGTGVRFRSSLSAVTATIGGVDAQVIYAGIQGDYVGLDQINIRIPGGLAGRGDVDVVLTVDGISANTVKVRFGGTATESFSVSTGEARDGRNCSAVAVCSSNVRFFQGQCGTVKASDGTTWAVPAAVNKAEACTDIYTYQIQPQE